MKALIRTRLFAAFCLAVSASAASAHPGHDAADHRVALQTGAATEGSTTGSGDLRFRYRADLSELPEAVAASLHRAHGGFAKGPDGEVYFGLKGVGVVRVSANLRDKTVIAGGEAMQHAGLHNTTYVDRDGGLLVLPDNELAAVYVLRKNGDLVATLGRPDVNEYYQNEENPYRPTDTDVGSDGVLYICDGYSPGKYMLTADLGRAEYLGRYFGGIVEGKGRQEGKFSTNHGVLSDPTDDTLLVADRERQWIQRVTLDGDFVEGYEVGGGDVCDIDFVEWEGDRLMIAGCLKSDGGKAPGFVQVLRDGEVVSTLRPKEDLGLELFQHIHNAIGIVVEGKLYVLCYGWNPGCYAVLEHVAE